MFRGGLCNVSDGDGLAIKVLMEFLNSEQAATCCRTSLTKPFSHLTCANPQTKRPLQGRTRRLSSL